MSNRFHLLRGDIVLGTIEHTEDDFPNHIGVFAASDSFRNVKDLFDRELALLRSSQLDEWRVVRSELETPGVSMVPIGPGKPIRNPLVHIEGDKVWWR